jgi:hypothetical protein
MSQTKFHVNSAGEPGPCSAQVSCPFGSSDEHFDTKEEARDFYEKKNSSTVLPQTLSKSELNRIVQSSTDPQILLHGATNGTDRTRGNLLKNPNPTPESLVAIKENSGDGSLKLRAQLHGNFPVEELDDVALDRIKEMANVRGDAKVRGEGQSIIRRVYSSNNLTDEELDRVTAKLGDTVYLRDAATNPDNNLSAAKIISLAENDGGRDINSYMLARIIERNPKYPVADRIEHLTPSTVSDLAGSIKDPEAIRNIVKYPADESTRAQTLYRVAINTHAPSDALEAIAKDDKSVRTGNALYKHPNATAELKRSLTDRSDELRALGRIDELRESDPKGMADFESSTKRITAVNVSQNKIQFDPEIRKRTKLTDEEVEVYARSKSDSGGRYDPETNIFTYFTESAGGRWTGD